MAKQKYYVVWEGKKPGVYSSWADCQKHISGFQDAKYKSYESKAEADKAYASGWRGQWGAKPKAVKPADSAEGPKAADWSKVDMDSVSVDVGCSGNPGIVEYKGVDTQSGEILFYYGPIKKGTNNLGEFLAIVHALAYLKQRGSGKTIYSDSQTALKWVRTKQVASNLARDESTREIWDLTDRALKWLQTNSYPNKVLKWDTQQYGEIKADFGRK